MGKYYKALILYVYFFNVFQMKNVLQKKDQKVSHYVHDWFVSAAIN